MRAFQLQSGLPPTGRLDMSTLQTLGLSDQNLAYFQPASRQYETWIPITKFKHGKWKVKWKKVRGEQDDQYSAGNKDEYGEYNNE